MRGVMQICTLEYGGLCLEQSPLVDPPLCVGLLRLGITVNIRAVACQRHLA